MAWNYISIVYTPHTRIWTYNRNKEERYGFQPVTKILFVNSQCQFHWKFCDMYFICFIELVICNGPLHMVKCKSFFWHVQQMEYWQTYDHFNTLAFAMKFIDISPIHYPWKNLSQKYENIHDNQNMLHELLFLFFKCALIIVNKSTNKRASKCLAR